MNSRSNLTANRRRSRRERAWRKRHPRVVTEGIGAYTIAMATPSINFSAPIDPDKTILQAFEELADAIPHDYPSGRVEPEVLPYGCYRDMSGELRVSGRGDLATGLPTEAP